MKALYQMPTHSEFVHSISAIARSVRESPIPRCRIVMALFSTKNLYIRPIFRQFSPDLDQQKLRNTELGRHWLPECRSCC